MVAPKATAVFLMMAMMVVSFADARQLKQGPSSGGVCAAFASASAMAVSTGGTAVSQTQAVAKAVCDCLKTGSGVAEAIAHAASSGNANTAAQAIAEAASGGVAQANAQAVSQAVYEALTCNCAAAQPTATALAQAAATAEGGKCGGVAQTLAGAQAVAQGKGTAEAAAFAEAVAAPGLGKCCPTCAPKSEPVPTKDPKADVSSVIDPKQLQEDLSCNCPRAVTAARAVSVALAQAGNDCGSGSGQALAQAFSSAQASGRGTAISQALAQAGAFNAQQCLRPGRGAAHSNLPTCISAFVVDCCNLNLGLLAGASCGFGGSRRIISTSPRVVEIAGIAATRCTC